MMAVFRKKYLMYKKSTGIILPIKIQQGKFVFGKIILIIW